MSITASNKPWAALCAALVALGFAAGMRYAHVTRDPVAAGDFGEMDAWFIAFQAPVRGRLAYPPGAGEPIRVELDRADPDAAWRAQLMYPCPPLQAGRRYRVHVRARADAERSLHCRVMENHPNFQPLGLIVDARVDGQWRDFAWTFTAASSDDHATVLFNVGETLTPVELSHLRVEALDKTQAGSKDASGAAEETQ